MLKIDQLRVKFLDGGMSAAEASAACRNASAADLGYALSFEEAHIALCWAFFWMDSPEGYDYWLAVYDRLSGGTRI